MISENWETENSCKKIRLFNATLEGGLAVMYWFDKWFAINTLCIQISYQRRCPVIYYEGWQFLGTFETLKGQNKNGKRRNAIIFGQDPVCWNHDSILYGTRLKSCKSDSACLVILCLKKAFLHNSNITTWTYTFILFWIRRIFIFLDLPESAKQKRYAV